MNYTLMMLLSSSILLPAVVGIVKVRCNTSIYPLVLCFWLGLSHTFLAVLLPSHTINASSNLYIVCEFLLILYQIHLWGAGFRRKPLLIIFFVGILLWGYTTFFYFEFNERNGIFRIFYSLLIVFCSIDVINKLAFERIRLIGNWRFMIALGFIFFFSYNIIFETFWVSKSLFTDQFLEKIFSIKAYINLSINILYFIALLCIPAKKKFYC